jgi:hypothetical protein
MKEEPNMKLNPVGSNQTEVERADGITVFYSYKTPVAAFVPGKGGLVTKTKYSVTTSRHINKAIARWGCSKTEVTQETINSYAA